MKDLREWLDRNGLGGHAQLFIDNALDLDVLADLSEADLKDIGLPLGDRKRFFRAVASLKRQGDVAPQDRVHASENSDEAERRQLTVMFSDLVGSTEMSALLDPEDLSEIIQRYQRAVTDAVQRFDGTVAKLMGDGVLAYFGWPRAHEDSVERAIRSGLETVRSIQGMVVSDQKMRVRVGIATGHVMVGDLVGEGSAKEESVVGETPNLAARLQATADPNSVVVSATSRRLAGGVFDFEDLGHVKLKGFPDSVRIWRAVQERESETRFDVVRSGELTSFVGRTHEVGLLIERWHQSLEDDGQVVLLCGEAGIGKSRILHTLRKFLVDTRHTKIRYQCSPFHNNSALFPVAHQLERAANFDSTDSNEDKLDKLEILLEQSSRNLRHDIPLIADLLSVKVGDRYEFPDAAPERLKEMTLAVLVDQLIGLTQQRPVLLILEDAHWIDPTTNDLFIQIVASVRNLRALVVVTFRPEFQPSWREHSHVTALTLNRLPRAQCVSIIDAVAGQTVIPSAVRKEIISKADGVPLFLEELTKAVIESGVSPEGDTLQDGFTVPTTLHDSLISRLDRLGPAKRIAQVGAVIGREFTETLICQVMNSSRSDLETGLNALVESALIFERKLPTGKSYMFKHALVQDTAYGSLLLRTRAGMHQAVARALEESKEGPVEPELLAHHFEAGSDAQTAFKYWKKAGQLAVDRSANVEAINHFARCTNLLGEIEGDREIVELEVLMDLGPPLLAVKGYASDDMRQTYLRARELSKSCGSEHQRFRSMWGLWINHLVRDELTTALELADQLVTLAERDQDRGLLVEANRNMGTSLFWLGQPTRAIAHLQRSIELYEHDAHFSHAKIFGQDPGVTSRIYAAWTAWLLGRPHWAESFADDALGLAKSGGHPFTQAFALAILGWYHCGRRDPESALQLSQQGVEISKEFNFQLCHAWVSISRGWGRAKLGEPHAGRAELKSSMSAAARTGSGLNRTFALALLADLLLDAGDSDEALGAVREAEEISIATNEYFWVPELSRLKSSIYAVQGKPIETSWDALREGKEAARKIGSKMLGLRLACDFSESLKAAGQNAAARELAEETIVGTEGFEEDAEVRKGLALLRDLQ